MAKDIIYRKVEGCIKHGRTNGRLANLKSNVDNSQKPCYICHACRKVYLEPENGDLGEANYRTLKVNNEDYRVVNILGPIALSDTVYVYNKETRNGECTCKGSIKKKTKIANHLMLKDGSIIKFSGIRQCKSCKKILITYNMYQSSGKLFEKLGVNVVLPLDNDKDNIVLEQDASKSTIILEQDISKHNMDTATEANWENEVFVDEIEGTDESIFEELQPADKVASAYYDAKITYNPYQYLPWLKMYMNGCKKILISDEVGLGKTIEAGILIMEELTENVNAKILVMCPAFLKEKWYQELNEKFLFDPQVFDGKTVIDESTSIVILPISRIKQYMDQTNDYNFEMVVVDEIHYFKNSNGVRYGQMRELLGRVEKAKYVFMSATPVNNSGNDYRSIEKLFGGKPEKTNTTKKQAYIHLPERHIHDVFVDLSEEEQEFYAVTDVLDPFSGTIYRHIGASCLYALGRYAYSNDELPTETKDELKASIEMLACGYDFSEEADYFQQIKKCSLPEIDSKLDCLKNVLRKFEIGSKVVIFSHYIESVKYLYSELSKEFSVGYIYANNISNNIPCKHIKNRFVDAKEWFSGRFAETVILICSDSCREGIDLDVANILINYDLPFNPSILEQRIGRIDRMSQKKDMDIYNFHVNNTYDDRLHFILSAKLRFINFYANYGIGNPLNITADCDATFNNFLRYFGQKMSYDKDYALMSNDDFFVASKILRMVGVKLEKKDGDDALHIQATILNKLKECREKIEIWFGAQEFKEITDEQLVMQKEKLDKLLGFPPKIKRKLVLNDEVRNSIVEKANTNPQFRKRIAALIADYSGKLSMIEITGLPMHVSGEDIRSEYVFGTGESDSFIQSSVIEIMRNEGAKVYEIS